MIAFPKKLIDDKRRSYAAQLAAIGRAAGFAVVSLGLVVSVVSAVPAMLAAAQEQNHHSTIAEDTLIELPDSRDEVLDLRREAVAAISHLGIYPDAYEPSAAVFKMTDGKGWTYYSGFYILNPQLLLITSPPVRVSPITYLSVLDNKSEEHSVTHSAGKTHIVYRGVSANHWLHWAHYTDEDFRIRIWDMNARDAGFAYAMVDLTESLNIDPDDSGAIVSEAVPLKGLFHYGDNVRANNLSPAYPDMVVHLLDYTQPTRIQVKLWREQPASTEAAADYIHIIEVHPNPEAADYDTIAVNPPRSDMNFFDGFFGLADIDWKWFAALWLIGLGVLIYIVRRDEQKRSARSAQRSGRTIIYSDLDD